MWADVYGYMSQPNGTVLLITGPLGGIVWGGLAGVVQFFNESRLHQREPGRFPPTPLDALVHLCCGDGGGDGRAKAKAKAPRTASSTSDVEAVAAVSTAVE